MSYAMAALPPFASPAVSDFLSLPQAVTLSASAADAIPAVAILVIRRKGGSFDLTEAPLPALVSRAIVTRVDVR